MGAASGAPTTEDRENKIKKRKNIRARQDWTFLKSPARAKWHADLKSAKLTNVRLYNLKKDPAQLQDLASSEPARYAEMKAKLKSLFAELQADAPVWNTDGSLTRPK